MASQEYILCIDVGVDSIKAAEFAFTAENVELDQFVYQEYTNDSDDVSSFEALLKTLKETIVSNHFKAKTAYLSLSGQNALIPFIKIPSMTTDPQKIQELVTYEASSRIPYPLDEVVWDYQLIDNPDGGEEIDAMLVSMKSNEVVAITEAVESTGCKVKSIEVSPTALYNSARANGIGESQCEMILNIGGRSSTLVFVDGPRFFVRSIPVAGNYITQQIAKEFNMSFEDAEEIKRRHGFVALGGAYEEPESDVAATVSKIVRNAMTRLHGEINRSINVYRATQHGRKPEKMYLAGGSSIMAFTPRFFVEKLRIPVDYFNAFKVVSVGPNVNQEVLQEQAHLCGEVIGLAIRHFRATPIEISLIPDKVKKQNVMRSKRPFFYAAAVALLAYLGITFWALDSQTQEIDMKTMRLEEKLSQKENTKREVESAKATLLENEKKYEVALSKVQNRNSFLEVLNGLQDVYGSMLKDGHDGKIWFTKISISDQPTVSFVDTSAGNPGSSVSSRRSSARRVTARKGGRQERESQSSQQWLNTDGFIVCHDTEDRPLMLLGYLMDPLKNIPLIDKVPAGQKIHSTSDKDYPGMNITQFNFSLPIKKQQPGK